MNRHPSRQAIPRTQQLAEQALSTLERFLHIEAVSGIVLLVAAAAALLWANSSAADSYHHFWHAPLSFGLGDYVFSRPLHFWINDALMTVFFLVVGMEIRREIHEGALSSMRLAALPFIAAIGGVVAPALIYLALNGAPPQNHGWAVPTATDIAFAVGVLALLGRRVPPALRIFLLALAIIDDIAAVLIIALFYSGGLDYSGLYVAAAGIVMVLALQRMGVGTAYAYVIPGAILWMGMLQTGAHPTLAGVVLGLMTPVVARRSVLHPLEMANEAVTAISAQSNGHTPAPGELMPPIKQLRRAQRELLAPVSRVQMALHPWVAYVVMPLFALANAGVTMGGVDLGHDGPTMVLLGVVLALVAGKPLGIFAASWLAVRMGLCALPEGMSWRGLTVVGLLAGIGFTMSIFIANLAFTDQNLLGAAKLGVLTASLIAAVVGLAWGFASLRRARAA